MNEWTVYLFSDTGKALWQQNYTARNERDAERLALKLVKPQLRRFPDAEDWVYEPASTRRAAQAAFTGQPEAGPFDHIKVALKK